CRPHPLRRRGGAPLTLGDEHAPERANASGVALAFLRRSRDTGAAFGDCPMSPALLAAFVGATALLMLIPGPNVALIVANSLTYGVRAGLLTVAGTSAAMVAQLTIASLGVTALLGAL